MFTVTFWCWWRKRKEKEKLKKKDHGNYFYEEKEMMKNFKSTLKRTRKQNTCAGSNEREYEDKKEKCEKCESSVKKRRKEWSKNNPKKFRVPLPTFKP